MTDDDDCGAIGGMKSVMGTEVLRENLGRHGGKPATNHLSYDTAFGC
jgi:hypothetical protein